MTQINSHEAIGILIRDKKFLVTRSKNHDHYAAPGGTIRPNETAKQVLIDELREEFHLNVKEQDLERFGTFTTEGTKSIGNSIRTYVFISNTWEGEPEVYKDVEFFQWIDSNVPTNIKLGQMFEREVINRLKLSELIN